jgi:hypothetical protein
MRASLIVAIHIRITQYSMIAMQSTIDPYKCNGTLLILAILAVSQRPGW